MVILKEKDREFVKSKFIKELQGDVKIIYFTQDFECEYCFETGELLKELSSLSERLNIEIFDFEREREQAKRWNVDKIPATMLFGKREYGIRFFGVPSGYEFVTLIEDIVDVSRGASRLSPSTKEALKDIKKPVHIQVFVTPTCPYCPRAVRIAHQMAIESEYVVADMIEVIEFPQLANKYAVMAVPKVVINDKVSFEGALPEQQFLHYILHAIE
ncbi:MAG: thioredoxin family protein [Nitrososphaerota archaeon]